MPTKQKSARKVKAKAKLTENRFFVSEVARTRQNTALIQIPMEALEILEASEKRLFGTIVDGVIQLSANHPTATIPVLALTTGSFQKK